jgi:exodeoxyribonuclease VII large subunit
MVVPVRSELVVNVGTCGARLLGAALRFVQRLRAEVRGLARGLPTADGVLALPRQRLDACGERLKRALRTNAHAHRVQFERASARHSPRALRSHIVHVRERVRGLSERGNRCIAIARERRRARLESLVQLLNALGYRQVLDRGFALVRDARNEPIRSAERIAVNDLLDIEFADGRIAAVAGMTPVRKRREPPRGGQGSLFG